MTHKRPLVRVQRRPPPTARCSNSYLNGREIPRPAGSFVYGFALAWPLWTGPEVYRHVEVAITTLRVLDGVRRLAGANEVGTLEWRGREGY